MAVCKHCHEGGFEWKMTAQGYRMFKDGQMHMCLSKGSAPSVSMTTKKPKVCEGCGGTFYWKSINGKWRLVDDAGNVHACKSFADKKKAQTDPALYHKFDSAMPPNATLLTKQTLIDAVNEVAAGMAAGVVTHNEAVDALAEAKANALGEAAKAPSPYWMCAMCGMKYSTYEGAAAHANSQHSAAEKISVKPLGHNVVKVENPTGAKVVTTPTAAMPPQHVTKAQTKKFKMAAEIFNAAVPSSKGEIETDELVDYNQLKQTGEIRWDTFFGLPQSDTFDLRVLCANVYAAERILHADPKVIKNAGLESLHQRSYDYIDLWANRFGKYVLASCLGEWRHRAQAGKMKLVPMSHDHKTRRAMQSAAMLLWGDSPILTDQAKPKIAKALKYMAESFGNPGFFPSAGYGGAKWAKIAQTMFRWVSGDVPNVVWLDYIWDVVHNGGRLFDKAQGMFQSENEMRVMLDAKSRSLDGDVRKWGTTFLHKDWAEALETLDAAKTKGNWIESKLGGQQLFGGD